LTFDQLNAYDVLVSDDIIFTQAALDAFVTARRIPERVTTDASTELSTSAVPQRTSRSVPFSAEAASTDSTGEVSV
uniref:hypothetical protein n=1 Tax=Escherichia marmotae TaxID=1499973 RepID=UPI00215ABC94